MQMGRTGDRGLLDEEEAVDREGACPPHTEPWAWSPGLSETMAGEGGVAHAWNPST